MEDIYKVGGKWLQAAASTTSTIASTTSAMVATSGARALGFIGSSSGRPEVPARAAEAAELAQKIAAVPPHERLSLSLTPTGSESASSTPVEELDDKFYEEAFDPVRDLLEQLPEESNEMTPAYFDGKVGGRLLQLDIITERLSKQVVENREEMVKGLQLVTELDRDLQLTSIICKNGRRFLSMASKEVTLDLLVAENVQRKQVLLDLLPVLERIQLAVDIKSRLDSTVEKGDFGLAMQLCSECVLILGEFPPLKAVVDINHSIEEWLQKTINNLDKVLLVVCEQFNAEKYTPVLLTYIALGDVPGLAEKAQTFFAQIIVSETHSIIRALVFEGQDPQVILQKSRVPYNDLCSQLTGLKFKECLHQSLEVLFDLLSSYYQMMTWRPVMGQVSTSAEFMQNGGLGHLRNGKQETVLRNGEPSADVVVNNKEEDSHDGPSAQFRDGALSVARTLEKGRKTVWELSARRIAMLLSCDALCATSPHHFLQSLDWVNKFILAGEAFCGVEAMTLRAKLVKQSEKYYWAFHRQNIEVLRLILSKELWQLLSSPAMKLLSVGLEAGASVGSLSSVVESDGGSSKLDGIETSQLTTREKSALRGSFDQHLRKGNPFTEKKMRRSLSREPAENGTSRVGMDGESKVGNEGGEEGEHEDLLADFIDEDSQLPGRILSNIRRNSKKSAQGLADEGSLMLTSSAVSILRYMEKYIKLMQILQPIVSEVFRGLCQLFELYFFTIFKVFGNRDYLTASLRSTLLRISQGLEEQRVQLPEIMSSSSATTQFGAPLSSTNTCFPSEQSPSSVDSAVTILPSNLYALKERAVGVESLLCLSQIFKKSHSHFKAVLPQDSLVYMEYFFAETVELVPALKVHVYKVAARSILNVGGYVDRISNSKWELKDLGMEHNGYVDSLLGEFKQYSNKLLQGNISKEVREAMLEYGVDVFAETILEGFSRVKRCTNEGRALMSLDLQVLINGLHHLASSRMTSNLVIVETYIKAFYLPETEYLHWIRAHPEYSKGQVVGLINLVAATYNWKRKTRLDLLEKIESGDP